MQLHFICGFVSLAFSFTSCAAGDKWAGPAVKPFPLYPKSFSQASTRANSFSGKMPAAIKAT
jgi:hypothetical protein